jgi:hypothetical protein
MLNTQLDKSIDIFWTGEKVCSAEYSTQHLTEVSNLLGRKPFLWDNYPVNDGAVKSNHLHLRGVDNSHSQIQQHVAGHALNPMNQAWLSQFAIASLTQAYTQGNSYNATNAFAIISQALCGKVLAAQLQNDLPLLQDKGLLALSTQDKALLLDRYGQFTNNPYCLEIIDWLQGGYTFDPACLTG